MNTPAAKGRMTYSGPFTLSLLASIIGLAYGVWYAYSVFLVALLNEFGWSRSTLAGAFSVFAIVHGCANPLVGYLCDRVRPAIVMAAGSVLLAGALYLNSLIEQVWHLYLTFGVATAIAVSLCGWTPSVILVQKRFSNRLGLALGIVSAGIGVGMLIVVPFCQYLIDSVGWRHAFASFSLVCLAVILPSALFLLKIGKSEQEGIPVDDSASDIYKHSRSKNITLAKALRGKAFWLMAAAFFFGGVCSQTLHVHQVAYLVDHGMQAMTAAVLVGIVGVASIVGKIGGGWLSDYVERELVYVWGISILVVSVFVLMFVGETGQHYVSYLYACLLGIGYSATAALMPAMMSDRFDGPNFGSILGTGLLGSALGSAVGPWMGGFLFDVTGSYTTPFLIAILCGVIAAAAGWNARKLRLLTKSY
jgi:predicted MFS family arabinose efflux permease